MVSHRFISADRTVQESIFSSGKKVVVNFSDNDYRYGDAIIRSRGFITY